LLNQEKHKISSAWMASLSHNQWAEARKDEDCGGLLKLLNKEEQLRLFSEVAYQISHENVEAKRFELLSSAFEKIGFVSKFRWRIGELIEDEKILRIKYGYGDYGGFDVTQIRYRVEHPDSEDAFKKDESLFFENMGLDHPAETQSPKLDCAVASFSQMWLYYQGKQVGIASIDSPQIRLFSAEVREALDPYKHLMVLALDQSPSRQKSDVIAFLASTKQNQVVVLGKDNGPELERLRSISKALSELGYKPVLLKDFPDLRELNNEQKAYSFLVSSRFAIIEDSFPSGAIIEMKMIGETRTTTARLRETGKGSTFMTTDYPIDYHFISDFAYDGSFTSICNAVKRASAWAEQNIRERANELEKTKPRPQNTKAPEHD